MRKNEVCEFIANSHYDKLRSNLPNDLFDQYKLFKEGDKISFLICLLDQDKDVYFYQMKAQGKLDRVQTLKNIAGQFFKLENYKKAARIYQKINGYYNFGDVANNLQLDSYIYNLNQCEINHKINNHAKEDEETEEFKKTHEELRLLKITSFMNLVVCKYKMKEFSSIVGITDQVIELDPKNIKCLLVLRFVNLLLNKYFPADLALLRSSNNNGIAYVETKNLDGETNLKHKSALKELQAAVVDASACTTFRAPNDQLYKFEGTVKTADNVTYSLDHNSILLRGTSLRNTEWVYGIVIYTGHDSKIMKNSSKSRTKFSKLEIQTNKQIILSYLNDEKFSNTVLQNIYRNGKQILIFLFQILICIIGASFNELWTLRTGQTYHPYLNLVSVEDDVDKNFWQGLFADSVTRFGTWLLLFANFVPISLIQDLYNILGKNWLLLTVENTSDISSREEMMTTTIIHIKSFNKINMYLK